MESSTNILQRILNNGVSGRSEFYESKILKKLSLYVPTKDYKEALAKLMEERFIIITGEPGIGKTTVSYLIICELLAKKYQLIYIDAKISEAEQLLSPDPKKKQVFFFDDFLGSNLYAIINPKNSESAILGFIERIQLDKNKLLILTTRTTILRQAEHSFEKLVRSKVSEISRYEIKISSYSRLNKAKILYNHLYHSHVFDVEKNKILKNQNYLKIIDHKNYSPRLIEFITNLRNYSAAEEPDYLKFISNALKNPREIWRGAYENQLGDTDRFLLTTLFSLGGYKVKSDILEEAFNERLKYEIENGGHTKSNNPFNVALKKLLDGLIVSHRDEFEHLNEYSFINPSVGDFLINYLSESKPEIFRIILSATYIDQWIRYFHPKKDQYVKLTSHDVQPYYSFFVKRSKSLKSISRNKSINIEVLKVFLLFFKKKINESDILPWTQSLSVKDVSSSQLTSAIEILGELHKYPKCKTIIIKNWIILIRRLYELADSSEEYRNIKNLFSIYDEDFNAFHSESKSYQVISECIINIFNESLSSDFDISEGKKDMIVDCINSGDRDYAESIFREAIEDEFSNFLSSFELDDIYIDLTLTLTVDTSEMIDKVYSRYMTENDDFESDIRGEFLSEESESIQIERLFER